MITRIGKITEWSGLKCLGRVQVGDGRAYAFGLTTYYPGRNARTSPQVGETVFVLCSDEGRLLRVEALHDGPSDRERMARIKKRWGPLGKRLDAMEERMRKEGKE